MAEALKKNEPALWSWFLVLVFLNLRKIEEMKKIDKQLRRKQQRRRKFRVSHFSRIAHSRPATFYFLLAHPLSVQEARNQSLLRNAYLLFCFFLWIKQFPNNKIKEDETTSWPMIKSTLRPSSEGRLRPKKDTWCYQKDLQCFTRASKTTRLIGWAGGAGKPPLKGRSEEPSTGNGEANITDNEDKYS